MIQPFNRIEGLSSTKYTAIFVGNEAKELVDKKRYEVLVELDPWDKLVNGTCECNGFKFRKTCKHINELLQLLVDWEEISKLPTVEKNEED